MTMPIPLVQAKSHPAESGCSRSYWRTAGAQDGPDSTMAEGFAMIQGMKQELHIKVSGDLEGDFAVTEERGEGEFVITRESSPTSLKEIRERSGARPATAEEFAAFEAEHGPFLPPDGEG